jgi:hypothetical protein
LELLLSAAVDGIGLAAATTTKGDCYDGGVMIVNGQNNTLI